MNELSEPDVGVFEPVRNAYAEFDPVPEDVLAAAGGALGWVLPTLPFGWCSASRNRGRAHAASPAWRVWIREVRRATWDRRHSQGVANRFPHVAICRSTASAWAS